MRSSSKWLAVVVASGLFAGAAPAQTTLRFKFKEGEKFEYVSNLDQKMSMSVGGQDIDMKFNMVMDMRWETIKIDDQGKARAKVVVSRVKLSLEGGPLGMIEVDSKSKDEPDNPIGQIFDKMVKALGGAEMLFTADSTGDVTDAKMSEDAVKKLKDIPGADKLGGDMLGPDSVKSMIEGSMLIPFPKDAISKGKDWSKKQDVKTAMGRMTGMNKYVYEGTIEKNGKKLEKIAVKTEDMKIEPAGNQPLKAKLKSNNTKGYLLFDNTTGRIAEASNEGVIEMEIDILGMTIAQTITQNQTMRLKGAGKTSEKQK
jgi:hypothetical protein